MKFVLASSVAAAALVSAASADVNVTFTNQTWTGFNFSDLSAAYGGFSGTLTGVSVNATLNASASFTYADDLCVYVDVQPLSTGGFLQIGGFSNLGAAQRYTWPNGASSAPGTTVIGTVNLTTALAFTSGTWTGSITLIGVNAVPAPGAIALLGLAGLAGRRRR
jgi:hypothetical protein